MELSEIDQTQITSRAIELMGGAEAFYTAADKELDEIQRKWNQNIDLIGRILRAHLFVEHYMTEYITNTNSRLGDLNQARLSFVQKTALLDATNPDMTDILPGIRQLNRIRNRLAHNLDVQVTGEDAKTFLESERFAALRAAREREKPVSSEPIDVLEDFAQHTSIVFSYEFRPLSRAMTQAITEAHAGKSDK